MVLKQVSSAGRDTNFLTSLPMPLKYIFIKGIKRSWFFDGCQSVEKGSFKFRRDNKTKEANKSG